jgi:hypothetical protein
MAGNLRALSTWNYSDAPCRKLHMAKRLAARSSIEIKDIKKNNDAYYRALSALEMCANGGRVDLRGGQHVDCTAL